jgi:DNA-binding MarR family transcriptional regulator
MIQRTTSQLQDELHQSKPFRSASQEAAVGLMRTADVLRRYFDGVLEPFGITASQYNVLRILRGAGEDGLPTLAIAERLIEKTPGITRMLDRLEAKGLIWRERCPEDRRRVTCRLTRAGSDLMDDTAETFNAADDKAMPTLSESERKTLIRLMDAIRRDHW